jgi:hypothetical protein
MMDERKAADNSTFAIGGVSCSADSFANSVNGTDDNSVF